MKSIAILTILAFTADAAKVKILRNGEAVPTKDAAVFREHLAKAAAAFAAARASKDTKSYLAGGSWSESEVETRALNISKIASRKHAGPNQIVPSSESYCQMLEPYYPSDYCTCLNQGALGATIECVYDIVEYGITVDSLGLILELDPCANPMFFSMEIQEATLGIDLYYELTGSTEEKFPLPGLSYPIPPFGEVGLFMDVYIKGNVDALTLDIGVDICETAYDEYCASDYYPYNTVFPVWILEGTFNFGDLC
jgi:hypothetical protein